MPPPLSFFQSSEKTYDQDHTRALPSSNGEPKGNMVLWGIYMVVEDAVPTASVKAEGTLTSVELGAPALVGVGAV